MMMNRFGFYEAMGKRFTSKLQAFSVTIPKGHHPHWNFFEEDFNQHNWAIEPDQTLENLYKERAKKIREKYDYVILSYSGGADSYNIAQCFLKNNIRIDELVNRISGNLIDHSNKKRTADNQANESIWAAWPTYQEFKKIQPDLKFTHWNWTDDILNYWKNNKKNIYDLNSFSPNCTIKSLLFQKCHIQKHSKNPVVVYGVDKPRVFYKNEKFYMSFLDNLVNLQMPWANEENHGINHDLFYWSPESTKILIKQGHIIKKWFKKNKELLYLLDPLMPNKDLYHGIVNSIVYPWFDKSIWQTQKQTANFFTVEERWFVNDSDHTATNNWRKIMKDYDNEVNTIYKDKLFFSEKEKNHSILPMCYSKFYDLGK
jgi:5-bromo-4-chloroindolyl phosphate hydrolysis protein